MRILVIVKDIDKNAAGSIFGNYINALSIYKDIEIDILTNAESSLNDKINKYIIVSNKKESNNKINKLLVILLKLNLNNFLWKKAIKKVLKQNCNTNQYDLVISFVSGSSQATAVLGTFAAKLYTAKLYIHMVDPIPPPKGWETPELYRRNLFFGIKKSLESCNLVSLSNDVMTDYQMRLLNKKKNYFTLPNPTLTKKIAEIKRVNDEEKFNYVFLGTALTGARSPYKLFNAFEKIIDEYPNSCLYFFGKSPRLDLSKIPKGIKDNIIFKDFKEDLIPIFSLTDVFIDIDGDLEYDVFISSKLQLYLSVNRPILSITGPRSPSRNLLKDMKKSTLVSSFNIDELANNLIKVRNLPVNAEFHGERNFFLAKNHISVLTGLLYNKLKEIIK